jgi:hypothetical protein
MYESCLINLAFYFRPGQFPGQLKEQQAEIFGLGLYFFQHHFKAGDDFEYRSRGNIKGDCKSVRSSADSIISWGNV